MLLFCLLFASVSTESSELCSNGAVPGSACNLIPSGSYECATSNSPIRWCESFNGTYKCCEKSSTKCKDRSSFCKMTKHLCKSKSDFGTMKAKCEATCGFCGLKSFEDAEKTRKRVEELAKGQDCDLPRKCVFPREKMLNLSTETTTEINIDPIIAYRYMFVKNSNTTQIGSYNLTEPPAKTKTAAKSTKFDLKTLLISTRTITVTPTYDNSYRNITGVSPKTYLSSKNYSAVTSFTQEASSNQTTAFRKLTLAELRTTRDAMPKITTAEPESLVTSLSKTVIQGTCFDEYTYCREFTSLCSHPAFSEVMASHCSLTCDRCDEVERVEEGTEDCVDMTTDCNSYRDLCQHPRYRTLMENYCPKACGHCIPMCRDRHQNCPQFFDDGFCNDTMYTYDERKYLCGATCLLC